MKKIKSKKPKETTRDRHLKWINYYCSKNFGIWIECTDCKKWRKTFQYNESHEVPEHWCCSLLTLENGGKGSCNDPEEENDEQYLEYCPGSVVWAKLDGYPWWPAMVDEDPDTEEFSWKEKSTLYYNVTFLDEKPTRAWISEMFICHFLKPPKSEKGSLQKFRQNRYAKAIAKAKDRAEAAMKMTIKDRLQTYSFVHLYKGHWPAAPNFEECNDEKNESKNVEDMADILLKELDELGSICSTDSDDEKIEKNFDEKENHTVEKEKLISKNSAIPSFKKKTYNTKYLNNKDFIPENEAIFPFVKTKNAKHSSSVDKTLSNVKYQTLVDSAESAVSSVQEKQAKGIKRKTNRKFTPRKEKNFEKLTDNSTDDINIIDLGSTDSEHETSNSNIVPNKDDSKISHVSKENSLTIDNENNLSETPNNENYETENKANNIKPSNANELSKKTNISKTKSIHSSQLTSNEEILKHIDESISKVLEFVENENLEISDESNNSERKKIIKASIELQKNRVKQKKKQNYLENTKQSKNKTMNLEENITQISQVQPETKKLQNANNSTTKINKQIVTETAKVTKKLPKNIKPIDSKTNEIPKQPKGSFSIPVKNCGEQNDEVVVDKVATDVTKKENKKVKPPLQNSLKDHIPSVKLKPNFKQPIKFNKQVSQNKIKDVKIPAETEKLKAADIKQKTSEECNENCQKDLLKSSEDRNDSANEKPTESSESEKVVSEPKEKVPEVISIDAEDSSAINGTAKPTDNHDDGFFYVTLSDDEMDCEI
ncbi:Zinc finger CW-type PWWP domain protein 1 like protein [Argiope bruennichi]|uniref:Zinc finger CW-type PWWP domain protein 1 like protein n=1 Tax=Argiope bruennichi TaxID=94029 RepID=A0A8T0DYU2_ARGBR|nr:Zinc finger CW-type PWWP domain protein 1 like protein [Argiope bruennichi]